MHIFLYEFVTGGGWYSCGDDLCPGSLVREGRAMVEALAADIAAIDGVSVTLLHDGHTQSLAVEDAQVISVTTRFEELAAFKRCCNEADWTIVIAPELSGFLAQRAAIVEKLGGRLLGPSLDIIRLASDKHATAEWLTNHGVRTPRGLALERGDEPPQDFAYPAVFKPRDGAGSSGLRLVRCVDDFGHVEQPSRLEEFCPGTAASVAFFGGPRGHVVLAPCEQRLSNDGRFAYLGGALPLPSRLAERAVTIASKAVATLGTFRGYVGVDLVLAEDENEDRDTVIEINSRPTTSYIGLRGLARTNLAEAMLQIAQGYDARIAFGNHEVQFDATGRVW